MSDIFWPLLGGFVRHFFRPFGLLDLKFVQNRPSTFKNSIFVLIFFVIFASGSVYGLEIALLRRGLELAVTFNFVDA